VFLISFDNLIFSIYKIPGHSIDNLLISCFINVCRLIIQYLKIQRFKDLFAPTIVHSLEVYSYIIKQIIEAQAIWNSKANLAK
jgi:hypothetical protein